MIGNTLRDTRFLKTYEFFKLFLINLDFILKIFAVVKILHLSLIRPSNFPGLVCLRALLGSVRTWTPDVFQTILLSYSFFANRFGERREWQSPRPLQSRDITVSHDLSRLSHQPFQAFLRQSLRIHEEEKGLHLTKFRIHGTIAQPRIGY